MCCAFIVMFTILVVARAATGLSETAFSPKSIASSCGKAMVRGSVLTMICGTTAVSGKARSYAPVVRSVLVRGTAVGMVVSALTVGTAFAASISVRKGETLSAIASQYHTTVAALATANHIADPNIVYAGQQLVVPQALAGAPREPVAGTTITVSAGETLTSIADEYHTTVMALVATDRIVDPNVIQAGAQIVVPTPGSPPGGASSPLLSHPNRLSLVGDFVESAAAYDVPVSLLEALCWWESGWQAGVVSVSGAIGVCQVEPSTAAFVNSVVEPGRALDVTSSSGNIAIGAAYLRYLLDATGDDDAMAVGAYYQGLTSIEHQGVLPATRHYVSGILAYAALFASGS